MRRIRLVPGCVAAVLIVSSPTSAKQGPDGEPTGPAVERASRFLEGLRERGYHDLAVEYADRRLDDPSTPSGLEPVLGFERGRGLMLAAESAPDLDRRAELLDRAQEAFNAFLEEYPDHSLAAEAKVQLAQLLYQRGQNTALKADEADEEAEAERLLATARAAFDQAREAFDAAIDELRAAYDAFPVGFIPEDDPRRAARDEAQRRLIDAMLKRALVDYDQAQTHPEGSDERNALLDEAIAQFKDLYDNYRTWMAGFSARMWQAKSLEEKGEYGPALGIYNELLGHGDPRLRSLQRQVAFFKTITHRKREEYPLAERLAREWLTVSKGDQGSYERLGVQLELAKNIDAMLEDEYGPAVARREPLVADLVEQLSEVVRYASPYKADAVELLTKYRGDEAIDRGELAGLSFEQAMERAREAMETRSYGNAIALFRAALSKVDPAREPDRANEARYLLAFTFYRADRFREAAVLADFLARRYPDWDSSLTATELGMSGLALAYEGASGPGRGADLARLKGLAEYTIATWPESPQADVARILLGDIALGQGRYAEAAEIYESVTTSTHRLDALSKAAAAHWRRSLTLREESGSESVPPEAEAEAAKALELLSTALEARTEAHVPPTDPGRLGNVGDLAEIHLAEGRPGEALAMLEPHVEALGKATLNDATRPLFARLLKLQLKAHIAEGRTEAAIADMKALKEAESGESLTQLFFGLGRLLEEEMEARREAGDRAGLESTRDAFEKFLNALIESETGQSFESLQWAGEQMLELERPDRAVEIFKNILETFPEHQRIDRTKLKLAEAHRRADEFNKAWREIDLLIKSNERALDFRIERCRLLEDWADVEPGYWNVAIRYWRELAEQLGRMRPRPPEYYECWYHVAWCYAQKGNEDQARKTLKSVMALSTSLGTPELKRKYEQLLGRVGG